MSDRQEYHKLLNGLLSGRYSRRQVMSRAAALGLSVSAMSTLSMAAKAAPGVHSVKLSPSMQDSSPTPKSGGTLKVGLQADPTALDMQAQSLTAIWHVVEHIYDTLVAVAPDLSPEPALAESWDISEDGKVYTFHLRQGVKFHDDSDFTADDVLFTFTRLLDPATASTSVSNLSSVVGAEEFNTGAADSVSGMKVVDPATIEMTLKDPDASFLVVLSDISMGIMSKAYVEAGNDMSQTAMGTGPFKFVEYIPNTSLKLEKHTSYWREGMPFLDGIDMLIIPEDTARTTSVVQGTTDFIEYAPLRDVDTLSGNSDLTMAGNSNTNIRYACFNFDREPFNDPKVRQAIAMVVDRGPIIDSSVFGHGTAVGTIFPPDYWAALQIDPPAPDIEGAKALLAEAGHADGFDTTITSWSQYSFLSNAAVVLQEQLKQIGINAELNLVENATMIQSVHTPATKDFDIGVTGTSAYVDPHPLMQSNFQTGGSSNSSNYSNPKVDDLINQGMIETDQAKRAAIYQQIQQILIEDAPWIFLFVANQYEAMKTYVQGYTHIPTGSNRFFRQTWLDQ